MKSLLDSQVTISLQRTDAKIPIINPQADLSIVGCDCINDCINQEKKVQEQVHVLASGSSIAQVDMSMVAQQTTIFVNGSIQLFEQQDFQYPVAYVISDKRFIEHNLELMQAYYQGQCPLFITQPVLENLQKLAPEFLEKIHTHIRLLYNYQKPIKQSKIGLLNKLINKIQPVVMDDNFIKLKDKNSNPIIGVSTDIRYGFVEAGTVAFVATQLAFSMGFKHIYLHGMDLLNSNQPRFYETQDNQAPCKLDKAVQNRIIPCFEFLAQTYREQGVLVYNGSPISKDLFNQLPFQPSYLQA